MPVQKFRSIEEMNKAPVPASQEPPFERFLRLCRHYWGIAPKRYPRGVCQVPHDRRSPEGSRNTQPEIEEKICQSKNARSLRPSV